MEQDLKVAEKQNCTPRIHQLQNDTGCWWHHALGILFVSKDWEARRKSSGSFKKLELGE